jgi:hypothetical protein
MASAGEADVIIRGDANDRILVDRKAMGRQLRERSAVQQKEQQMYPRRRSMVKQALRLGLLVTLVILALSACSGGGSSAQEEANKARPLPENNVTLRPGEYRSEEFKPSLSFRVGKGWTNVGPQLPDKLSISIGGGGGDPLLIFRNLQEVLKPGTDTAVKAPKDMVGWFQHHPYLQTTKPEPVMVGGVKGQQFDWVVAEDSPYKTVNTFRYSDGFDVSARKGFEYRAIVLEDVKGETVTIGVGSPASEFDEFVPEAQKVLDTVKWGGS